ncbi:MAG: nucleotidyltransferase domain-containing protein [Thermodesulfobacteriota bacterium]
MTKKLFLLLLSIFLFLTFTSQSFSAPNYHNYNQAFINTGNQLTRFVEPDSFAYFFLQGYSQDLGTASSVLGVLSVRGNLKNAAKLGARNADNVGRVAIKQSTKVGGGAKLSNLSKEQIDRIQKFANQNNVEVTVVGSRASGKSGKNSDFDFIVGGNSKIRKKANRQLPRGISGGQIKPSGRESGIDVFNETRNPLDPNRPFIKFLPIVQ